MRTIVPLSVVLSVVLAGCRVPTARPPRSPDPLQESRQVVLVLTDTWDAVDATVQRFERSSDDGAWRPVGSPAPVVVGRAGLAWGRGLASPTGSGPVKREGDGRAPAGVFALSTAFGQSKDKPAAWRMPYTFLGNDVECVDDATSSVYNHLTTKAASPAAAWSSSEKMWQERLYKWGVVVDYNAPNPIAGAGSCIFLHVWQGPGRGTAGCTAMEEATLTEMIAWLSPDRHPRLVQLPRAEYEQVKKAWHLPVAGGQQ